MLKWSAFNDNNQFLFLNDLLLGPIFIIIVLFFCNNYIKNKKIQSIKNILLMH